MQMYKNRNGNSKQRSVASTGLHTLARTHTRIPRLAHTYKFNPLSHTLVVFGYAGLDGYKRTTSTVTLEKTVRVKIIPACERVASRLSVCPRTDRQTSQTDSEKTQSVCDSHCKGQAVPHSAVNRQNTRKHTHTHTYRQTSVVYTRVCCEIPR